MSLIATTHFLSFYLNCNAVWSGHLNVIITVEFKRYLLAVLSVSLPLYIQGYRFGLQSYLMNWWSQLAEIHFPTSFWKARFISSGLQNKLLQIYHMPEGKQQHLGYGLSFFFFFPYNLMASVSGICSITWNNLENLSSFIVYLTGSPGPSRPVRGLSLFYWFKNICDSE